MSGNIFHFESLKSGRNVVLGDVVRGGFLGDVVEHVFQLPRWQISRHVTTVMRVRTGLTSLNCYAPSTISAGEYPKIQIQELFPERGFVRCVR